MTNHANSTDRWVVAHCGSRDRYQLPVAFHEAGQLHRFVTDWYSPMDSLALQGLLRFAPQRATSSLARRFCEELPSRFVRDVKLGGTLNSIRSPALANFELARIVGEKAARITAETGSHLLITSYYGWAAFPRLSKHTKKVLFQVHPHPWFLHELYRTIALEEGVADAFLSESEMRVPEELLRRWGQESLDADVVVATSSFTRKSLLQAGVTPEKIRIVPYGVDSRVFRNDIDSPTGKPKLLFIGQPTARKGFGNLLKVWERLGNHEAELHIASGSLANRRDVRGGPVFWYGRLSSTELVALINRSDLLVLPSIAEGFGLVLLEALSCGTPILCSDASAGPDLLAGWDDQFVFPAGDWDGLASRLDYLLSHVDLLRGLRGAARNVAESMPWGRFRNELREACSAEIRAEQPGKT
jgi:glycosyltransferase involved in cell wall biosynthesis